MLCYLLSPICPTHLRKDKSFKPLPVGKLAEILALMVSTKGHLGFMKIFFNTYYMQVKSSQIIWINLCRSQDPQLRKFPVQHPLQLFPPHTINKVLILQLYQTVYLRVRNKDITYYWLAIYPVLKAFIFQLATNCFSFLFVC